MIRKNFPALILASAATAVLLLPACKPAPQPAETAKPSPTATPAQAATPASSPAATPASTDNVTSGNASATAVIELKDPVATVNGEAIPKSQLEDAFKAAVEGSGVKSEDLTPEQKIGGYRQILDELIMDKLVAKAAAEVQVTDADVEAEIAKLKKQFPDENAFNEQLKQVGQTPEKLQASMKTMLQQQRWMQEQIKGKGDVAPDEAQKFYDSNKQEFENPEMVKASHILFMVNKDDSEDVVKKKEAAAKSALARAKKGEDFNKLAKELSEEPGAKDSGGELGFFSKDRMVPEFAEASFTLKPGTIGGPVRTQFGWHVIKVEEKKPAGTTPFVEVKEQIVAYLKNTKERQAVQEILANLRKSAQIDNTLPPATN